VQDFKTRCKVGHIHEGYAHIVEQTYDESFKLWYGCLRVACTDDEWYALTTQDDVPMQLPDGRSMTIRVLRLRRRGMAHLLQGEPLDSGFNCYFVSTAPLINVASLFPGFIH
jgi:hypothetical protein